MWRTIKMLWKNEPIPVKEYIITHADRIKGLKNDEFVSGDWIKKLINTSRKPEDLLEIRKYLKNPEKTANMGGNEVGSLIRTVNNKIKDIEKNELLEKLLKSMKEGMIFFTDVM